MIIGINAKNELIRHVSSMCLAIGNTPRENNKIKLTWSEPVIFIELHSYNVYKARLLNGEIQVAHGSRLYFYEHDGFVSDDSLRKVFVNNWEELEV
eukprot:snap_masked-scaffold_4-processed-gene-13.39-mRNA-1 protein AED:1.00 eAED:1.00 QI:0/0/0/0/1/1/2/0/95